MPDVIQPTGFSPNNGATSTKFVRAATQADVADLAAGAPLVTDGVTLVAGDLVLVPRQVAGAENGMYFVTTPGSGADGVWTRAFNFDIPGFIEATVQVYVREGTLDSDVFYRYETDGTVVVDTTVLVFRREPGGAMTWGAGSIGASTTTRYLFPGFGSSLAQTVVIQWESPRAGVLRLFRVRHNTPRGNGNDVVYTVRINGVPTVLTVTLASNASSASDTTNAVAVAQGDLIDIEVTKALTIASSPSDVEGTLEYAA